MDWLDFHAARQPDKVAIQIVGDKSISYATLDQTSRQMAQWFRSQGLRDGDTIALLLENDILTPTLWWAARRAGLYYVPLGTRLRPGEIAYILSDSGARALIAAPSLMSLADAARAEWPDADACLFATPGDAAAGWVGVGSDEAPTIAGQAAVVGREIIYSSGTTGRPKGIRRALTGVDQARTIPVFEQKLRLACALDRDSVYLSVSPLYHATGRYVMRIVEGGGTAVILSQFDAAEALAAIEKYHITHSQWVPTMFTRLLDLPAAKRSEHDLSSHRVALHAAAPCPVDVKRAMIAWWGPILSEYYGGSENAGVTFITAEEWLQHPGSVGRSITGAIHILDEDGSNRELATGEIGLIYFEGGVPFQYINQDTPSAALSDRGYATYGDLGHVDSDGYLFISDRRSDLIIRGGVNIYPREVELALEAHPAVREVAVVGVSDAEYGQQVKAVVVPAENCIDDDRLRDMLVAHCRAQLASIKCPTIIDFAADLPRNENGKLLKRVLRADHATVP